MREDFAKQLLVLLIRCRRQAELPPKDYVTHSAKNRWKCAVSESPMWMRPRRGVASR